MIIGKQSMIPSDAYFRRNHIQSNLRKTQQCLLRILKNLLCIEANILAFLFRGS